MAAGFSSAAAADADTLMGLAGGAATVNTTPHHTTFHTIPNEMEWNGDVRTRTISSDAAGAADGSAVPQRGEGTSTCRRSAGPVGSDRARPLPGLGHPAMHAKAQYNENRIEETKVQGGAYSD